MATKPCSSATDPSKVIRYIWSPSGVSPTSATTSSTSYGLLLSVKILPSTCAYQLASPRAVTSSRAYW